MKAAYLECTQRGNQELLPHESDVCVAFGCAVWAVDPPSPAVLVMFVITLVLPAITVSAAFYARRYARTFFVGMSVPLCALLIWAVNKFVYFIPTTWDRLSTLLNLKNDEIIWYDDTMELLAYHRQALILCACSIFAGVVCVLVQWLLRKTAHAAD